jgi:hypothetical protein
MGTNPFDALTDEGESEPESPEVPAVDPNQLVRLNTIAVEVELGPQVYRPPFRRGSNETGLTPTTRPPEPVQLPPLQTGTQLPPRQFPTRRAAKSYRDHMRDVRPTNTASNDNNQSNYIPGMIIRTMHFEESIPTIDAFTSTEIKYTTNDGRERTAKVNPKYRYFIIVHCYERQSFTAEPIFTYGRKGFSDYSEQDKLGYMQLPNSIPTLSYPRVWSSSRTQCRSFTRKNVPLQAISPRTAANVSLISTMATSIRSKNVSHHVILN